MNTMNKCGDCKYWTQYHVKEGYRGCLLWNKYKHYGTKPYRTKGAITCPNCQHEITLRPEHFENEEDYEKSKSDCFYRDLDNSGLKEIFEGWVGKGVMTNNCIITKESDSCKYFEQADKI